MATIDEAPLQIRCLGKTEILYEGRALSPGLLSKAQALLIYLALEPNRHQRDTMAALLWSEMPEKRGRANLRTALSRLRRPLAGYLDATRHTVAFDSRPGYWLDVAHFERTIVAESSATRREAISLYEGDFLAGFSVRNAPRFEQWAMARREQLRALALQGLSRLAKQALDAGDYPQAMADLRRLLDLDPWREAAHRSLMRALAASGDRAAALAQFDRCRQTLVENLGVQPTPETVALYEQIKLGQERAKPEVKEQRGGARREALSTTRTQTLTAHNLPARTTPFVGRQAELAQITHLLADPGCRLLTLFGPGGVGKTRLGVQALRRTVRQSSGAFPDGVFLVALESVASADLLVSAIAGALGISFGSGPDPRTQLLATLQQREMLLLLDNFEHLLPAGELLLELLEAAPGLKFLVTSRVALNLYEERLLKVEGLSYPPEGDRADPERFDAVFLFLQRAQRVDLNFSLAGNETAVADICRRLLGMPLAIELAAAWVRTIPCREIAREIATNLDILKSSLRNVPDRHRSLTAVFDHSWALLRREEQQQLRRLSLFRGGFRAATAGEVAGTGRRDLSSLVDKALLRVGDDGRYEFHPLIRHYAAGKLAARPQEQAEVRARHGRAFAAFLQKREPHLHDERQPAVLADVHREIDNVHAGWQWAVAHRQTSTLDAYLETMASAYVARGQFGEGRAAINRAVEALQDAPGEAVLLGRLLTWQARFELLLGHSATAERYLERAVALLRPLDAPIPLGRALTAGLGQVYLRQGEHAKSIAYLKEGLPLLEAAQDLPGQAEALLYLSMARFFLEGEESEAEQALAIYEQLGDHMGMARALVHMGNTSNARGEYDAAENYYRRSLKLNQELGDRQATASCLINLATIAKRRGAHETSRKLSRRSLAMFKETGARFGVATALNNLGDLALSEGDGEAAREWYTKSLVIRREIDDRLGEGLLLHNLSRVAMAQGQDGKARRYLKEALAIADGIDAKALLMQVLVGAAHYLAQNDERERAIELLALVSRHSASNQQTRNEAAHLLEKLGAASPGPLSGASQSRVDTPDLSRVVRDLFA